jgi:DNA-binding NtrC family response regulator
LLPVIVASAQPTVAEAVRVMQLGADSYVPLPQGDGVGGGASDELNEAIQRLVQRRRSVARLDRTRRLGAVVAGHGLVGESPAMKALLQEVGLVAPTKTTVLILGETGTGKERIAQAIHQGSPRRNAPFIGVNCAALSETLLESELFGHEKGAFSGAHVRHEGRFKMADGGTLFLDEIGEISLALQVKLLRVLQERQFERVGGSAPVSVDVRIVAATNQDLRRMVAAKTFRSDLFYRLNVMVLRVPALRDRPDDIRPLIVHVLSRLSFELGIPKPTLSPELLQAFSGYQWPGNVRELENVLERLLVVSQGRTLTAADFPAELRAPTDLAPAAPIESDQTRGEGEGVPTIPGSSFRTIERHAILTTYEACGRSPTRTAEILGLSLRTVHYRLREYRGQTGRRIASAP